MGRQSRTIKSWKFNQNENLDHFLFKIKTLEATEKQGGAGAIK